MGKVEEMDIDTAVQESIARLAAKRKNFIVTSMPEYIYDDEIRIGSSFDFAIGDDGLVEAKNVDYMVFRDNWIKEDDGNIEAPLFIEIQVQVELMMSQRKYCWIAALIGGNKLELIKREPNPKVFEAIKLRVSKFWSSIEENRPPKPNFVKDAEFISKLYGFADPGKFIDVTDNEDFIKLAREHKRLGDIMRDADAQRDAIKAQMLMVIGDAEKVEGGEFSISAGMIAGGHVSYDRKPYRNFKPSWRKQK